MTLVLPLNKMISILQKVRQTRFESLESIVTGRNPFGLPANDEELAAVASDIEDTNHTLRLFCAYEKICYISSTQVTRRKTLVGKWKIFTSKMNGGAGTLLDNKPVNIIGKTFLAGPNSVCSNALIAIGSCSDKSEAINLQKYIHGKFFRFMLGIKKIAQVITSNIYHFVPIQDFTENSEINWSKSLSKVDKAACEKYGCDKINEIDAQLYDMYDLSSEEVQFIESMIKPME